MKRTLYVSAATAVVLMAGGPVAVAAATTADTARTVTAATAVPADVTAQEAAAAALKEYPGIVESLDQDGAVWHVDVISKGEHDHAELEVDANGKVTVENKDNDGHSSDQMALLTAKVTAAQAMKAALAAHPGKVTTVEWDNDDNGTRYWHVEVKGSGDKTWDGRVDATTAKVTTSTDSDSNNDSDSDSNDEDQDN
ncbi:PepSY domain-containing protein [Streptomyces sp. NRRL S-237]|uniref:PepSY domain-containing protein n=1 Tax=Streptomyces sp. NRRL S-237 TaxID=1463895 RepID=UPI0004CA54CF|nr:PepSY domain-containing protein [Streptomyces sp. NRRL S-237]